MIPNSTNTWQQTIEAAEESKMLPASALECARASPPGAVALPVPSRATHAVLPSLDP